MAISTETPIDTPLLLQINDQQSKEFNQNQDGKDIGRDRVKLRFIQLGPHRMVAALASVGLTWCPTLATRIPPHRNGPRLAACDDPTP